MDQLPNEMPDNVRPIHTVKSRPPAPLPRTRPLYVDSVGGRVDSDHPAPEDFGPRLARIRTSLGKINRLMSELKRMGDPND